MVRGKSGKLNTEEISVSREDPKDSKHQVYWKVLRAVLDLDFRRGHLKWTISDLSRSSKVTRSLIYYYFGRSKEDIISEAVRFIGKELFGLSPERMELWEQGKIGESVEASRRAFSKYPFFQGFYFSHRFRPSPVGEQIRELEKMYFEKIKQFYPELGAHEVSLLGSMMLGFVVGPEADPKSIQRAVDCFVGKKQDSLV